jgi:acyl-homoserine-lactone acylase
MRVLSAFFATALLAASPPTHAAPTPAAPGLARLRAIAAAVTITRDTWGIAHIRAHTDAQAVFGMITAQAEDDFNRIETNYLTALGRLAEADGEAALMQDLRARLYIDPADLQTRYAHSPAWLRALMDGWADGLNFFLATHPNTKPRVLYRFEPWMALAFSEGSIGGDIERIALAPLADFYDHPRHAMLEDPFAGLRDQPTGSNGIAIAPQNTRDHHALLLINPHTSFYFRSELQMTSDAGLNAYGAATWGQFFLYQGFNDRLGWMHTSSTADAVDQFLETIVEKDGKPYTRYGNALRPLNSSTVTLAYKKPDGRMAQRSFTILRGTHGPIVGKTADGHWIAAAMMFRPVEALAQSYRLTKAQDYQQFMTVMALQANTSNNTVYADADGHIALLLPQFIPNRDDRFDYTKPVDGADPRTDWHGLLPLDRLPHVLDPATGWIQNTNNWPYSAAGADSPARAGYPRYLDTEGENMRGIHAIALLAGKSGFTLPALVTAAFDPHLTGFEKLLPLLLAAYDHLPANDARKAALAGQIAVLRAWDRKWATDSIATTLAVTWGEALWRAAGIPARDVSLDAYTSVLAKTTPAQDLAALAEASGTLTRDFGTWRIAWGDINRFQRLTDSIAPHFSDAAPSLPVGFTSAKWGSLASITGPREAGVKKRYGNSGNSFVAVVEFGPQVRAVAVTAGGESGDPASRHFDDQAQRYATGTLRAVYFTPADLAAHTERIYHPGS